MSTFNSRGEIDPAAGRIIACFGRKGSGKSIIGLMFCRAYPGDRLIIDVAGDDGPIGPDVITIRGTVADLPAHWPEHLRPREGERMTIRYVPDPGSATYLEDIDRVLGWAYQRGDCLVVIHEVGDAFPAGKVPPMGQRLLRHNRHRRVTMALCGPRTLTVDPLVIAQADLVYVFSLPNPADRRRVADCIGMAPMLIDTGVAALRAHEALRFDANQAPPDAPGEPDYRLMHMPPLPSDVVAELKRWSAHADDDEYAARLRT